MKIWFDTEWFNVSRLQAKELKIALFKIFGLYIFFFMWT